MARVNKAFFLPAVRTLWANMTGLGPLFKILSVCVETDYPPESDLKQYRYVSVGRVLLANLLIKAGASAGAHGRSSRRCMDPLSAVCKSNPCSGVGTQASINHGTILPAIFEQKSASPPYSLPLSVVVVSLPTLPCRAHALSFADSPVVANYFSEPR